MISRAVVKYLRISPRKVRVVIALIKNKHVDEAIGILSVANKKAAFLIMKLLNSAIANAKRFPNIKQEDLYISDIHADGGPLLKRTRAEAMGRASVIRKTTSHITIELDADEPKVLEQPKQQKPSKIKKVSTGGGSARARKKATKVTKTAKVKKIEKINKKTQKKLEKE